MLVSFYCSSSNTIPFFTMVKILPVHMSNDDEETIDNKSKVSALSGNEEEIEYDSASETNLDSDFNEEDEFQARIG